MRWRSGTAMSETPTPRAWEDEDQCRTCGMSFCSVELARQLERELAEMKAKYAAECDASMMAGSQNSALRLQLRGAEHRASENARAAALWRDLPRLHQMDLMVIFGGAESDGVLLSKLAEW